MRRCTFAGSGNTDCLLDQASILRFGNTLDPRPLVEGNRLNKQFFETVDDILRLKGQMLQSATVVDATIFAVPCSTKNGTGKRDPEMHQTNTRFR